MWLVYEMVVSLHAVVEQTVDYIAHQFELVFQRKL